MWAQQARIWLQANGAGFGTVGAAGLHLGAAPDLVGEESEALDEDQCRSQHVELVEADASEGVGERNSVVHGEVVSSMELGDGSTELGRNMELGTSSTGLGRGKREKFPSTKLHDYTMHTIRKNIVPSKVHQIPCHCL